VLPIAQQVIEIIQEVSRKLVLPRFRQLKESEIKEKSPGNFVTIVDLEAEAFLKKKLINLIPGSLSIGEEEVETKPMLLELLREDKPVWLLDPLDGTGNFAFGRKPFAIIVAYCFGGETLMGWVHDPLTGETVWAGKGKGCWKGDKRLRLPNTPDLKDMTGSLGKRYAKRIKKFEDSPQNIRRLGCVGKDYIDLVLGNLNFARYSFYLKPWDHAAGVLLHTEAGGHNHLFKADRSYYPALMPEEAIANNEVMLLAPDMHTIKSIADLLNEKIDSKTK